MEGLGESEGKAAIFAFQKMSALCLGGDWHGSPYAWEGTSVGVPPCGEALERAGWGAGARAALQQELRALCMMPEQPWNGLCSCRWDWGCAVLQ